MEDSRIIDLFWKRSEQAIVETKKKYNRLCMKVSLNVLRNREDAEECVSDSYLGVWNTIPDAWPKHFSAYVCKITRNLSLKRLDYNMAGKRSANLICALEELEEELADDTDLEKKIEAKELAEVVQEYLLKQNLEKRNILMRRYFFFDGIPEIAKMLGIHEAKVKSILFRERKKLKEYLTERGF